MSKHLIVYARSTESGEDEVPPDVFVLPLQARDITEFQNKMHIAKSAYQSDASLKGLVFQFLCGHWMVIEDKEWLEEPLNENGYAVLDLEDIVAIVGEDVYEDVLVVDPMGNIHFECRTLEESIFVYTDDIKLKDLENALGV